MNEAIRMQLSAFADGELPDNEKELLLRRLSQDAEMRRQVAEYMAIGRAMRGDATISGVDTLRDRIAEAIGNIDTDDASEAIEVSAPTETRVTRPLAGMAIAATVALAAIFGLRQMSATPEVSIEPAPVAEIETAFPTQPDADNVLKQYRLLHDAEAAGSSMRTRFTAIEVRQGIDIEDLTEADPATLPSAVDRPADEANADAGMSAAEPAQDGEAESGTE
jgi:hypothetical protein